MISTVDQPPPYEAPKSSSLSRHSFEGTESFAVSAVKAVEENVLHTSSQRKITVELLSVETSRSFFGSVCFKEYGNESAPRREMPAEMSLEQRKLLRNVFLVLSCGNECSRSTGGDVRTSKTQMLLPQQARSVRVDLIRLGGLTRTLVGSGFISLDAPNGMIVSTFTLSRGGDVFVRALLRVTLEQVSPGYLFSLRSRVEGPLGLSRSVVEIRDFRSGIHVFDFVQERGVSQKSTLAFSPAFSGVPLATMTGHVIEFGACHSCYGLPVTEAALEVVKSSCLQSAGSLELPVDIQLSAVEPMSDSQLAYPEQGFPNSSQYDGLSLRELLDKCEQRNIAADFVESRQQLIYMLLEHDREAGDMKAQMSSTEEPVIEAAALDEELVALYPALYPDQQQDHALPAVPLSINDAEGNTRTVLKEKVERKDSLIDQVKSLAKDFSDEVEKVFGPPSNSTKLGSVKFTPLNREAEIRLTTHSLRSSQAGQAYKLAPRTDGEAFMIIYKDSGVDMRLALISVLTSSLAYKVELTRTADEPPPQHTRIPAYKFRYALEK